MSEFRMVSQEEFDKLEGKRVRVTIMFEGQLERADYGAEILVNCCGAVRYFKKDNIDSIEEI
jgi:hypothetical protein